MLSGERVQSLVEAGSYCIIGRQGLLQPLQLGNRLLIGAVVGLLHRGGHHPKVVAEGIEWAAHRAIQNGATWEEVYEAAFLAGLPAGIPAFEAACRTFKDLQRGKGWVKQKPLKKGRAKKRA